jgi:hypothetical protein
LSFLLHFKPIILTRALLINEQNRQSPNTIHKRPYSYSYVPYH